MIYRLLALVWFLQVLLSDTYAQTSGLPSIAFRDFEIPNSPIIDSTSHAVIIIEKGKADIQVDDVERELRVIHRDGARIRIVDKERLKEGTYVNRLYRIGN